MEDYASRNLSFDNNLTRQGGQTDKSKVGDRLGVFLENSRLLTEFKKSCVNSKYSYKLSDEIKVTTETSSMFVEENYILKIQVTFQNISHLTF